MPHNTASIRRLGLVEVFFLVCVDASNEVFLMRMLLHPVSISLLVFSYLVSNVWLRSWCGVSLRTKVQF